MAEASRQHPPGFRVGSRILVETSSGCLAGTCAGFRSGAEGEDFERVDILMDDGRRWLGCHPRHVRRAD